jgi:hypothetical protein
MKALLASNSHTRHGWTLMRTGRYFVLVLGIIAVTCVCPAAPSARPDAWFRQKLVGSWTTREFGQQTLTNFSDGTARLDVKLNRLPALRYGKTLQLDLEWTVSGGVLRHKVVGGSPPEKVARLVRDWGSTLEYEIVEVTDSHMLLEKPDDEEEQTRWDAAATELAQR